MNQYLLLRDNKQTGPYTAQELAAKGLKAYDLVWQEGKSAAWRYPSEIDELKPFAPVVEEQPYDRFYKKTGEQTADAQPVAQAQQPVQQVQPVITLKEEQPVSQQAGQTAKHIYVTMPGSKTQTATVAKKEETRPVTQQTQQYSTYNNASSTKTSEKKPAASSYIVSKEDDEENSSLLAGYQSRKKEDDEINNSYLSDYEQRKAAFESKKPGKQTTKQAEPVASTVSNKKESFLSKTDISSRKSDRVDLKALLAGSGRYLQDNKNLTRGLLAAVLILGGVVIGLVINSGHRQPDTQALESLVKEIRQQNERASSNPANNSSLPVTETARKSSKETEDAGNYDKSNTDPAPSPAQRTEQSVVRHAILKKEQLNTTTPVSNKPIAEPISNTNNTPAEPIQAVVETRDKAPNQEMLEKARRNIYDMVHVEASAFKVGLLGGISDLDITVLNSSSYPLDQVSVEIRYLGPEKKLVKSQTLVFNNVPAGKRRTLEAPRTNRGISIDYSVTSINSKVLGLAQAGN